MDISLSSGVSSMLIDVLRHEWRLLKRSRLAWLLSALYVVLAVAAAVDMLKFGIALFFDNYHRLSAFVTLPLLLFGAHLARRDETDRFHEIQAVQPVGNSVLIGGRLLVGAGAAVAAAAVQAAVAAIYTFWRGAPLHLFTRALVDVGVVTLVDLLCAVTVGYMIGVIAGRRAALAVTAACWLSQFAIGVVSTAPGWVFAAGHEPLFIENHVDCLASAPKERDALLDALGAKGGVYFCGHDHFYIRAQAPDSAGRLVTELLVGSGGAPMAAISNEERNKKIGQGVMYPPS
jgi:MFS family permease